MTVRRSQIFEALKPGQSRQKSELPKSLEREGRFNSEQARSKPFDEPAKRPEMRSVFSRMLAVRADKSQRECSIPSNGNNSPHTPAMPVSRGHFKRVVIPAPLQSEGKQVYRRVIEGSTLSTERANNQLSPIA